MGGYLTPDSPKAFEGMTKKEPYPAMMYTIECPKCHGYGGWHLRLKGPNDAHNFDASCDQCLGWGFVDERDSKCVHTWDFGKTIGRCLTLYTCTECGRKREIDSSD
jgi:DnaJ-class molecular chaperone